ncbi:MAG TPA: rod-binding protein [Thermoclostridium caenicola]|nr:rod-binding protein [Thermoclostridium caenicola]
MKIEGFAQQYMQNVQDTRRVTDSADFEAALRKAYNENDKQKLKEACIQFESIMLQTLYKQMKATVPKGGLFEESNARNIFQDMLDEELMSACSKRGVGIADMMYRQLSAQMERTYVASGTSRDEADLTGDAESESSIGAEMVEKPMD